jgi:post-segregation antitoxin (ccd killing protein)
LVGDSGADRAAQRKHLDRLEAHVGAAPRGNAQHAYAMRMARVNITVPDDLLGRAKAAGLNVSRLAAAALAAELERRAKVAALDAYLAELDAEFGPIPQQESVAAREWADQVLSAGSGVDAAHTA